MPDPNPNSGRRAKTFRPHRVARGMFSHKTREISEVEISTSLHSQFFIIFSKIDFGCFWCEVYLCYKQRVTSNSTNQSVLYRSCWFMNQSSLGIQQGDLIQHIWIQTTLCRLIISGLAFLILLCLFLFILSVGWNYSEIISKKLNTKANLTLIAEHSDQVNCTFTHRPALTGNPPNAH